MSRAPARVALRVEAPPVADGNARLRRVLEIGSKAVNPEGSDLMDRLEAMWREEPPLLQRPMNRYAAAMMDTLDQWKETYKNDKYMLDVISEAETKLAFSDASDGVGITIMNKEKMEIPPLSEDAMTLLSPGGRVYRAYQYAVRSGDADELKRVKRNMRFLRLGGDLSGLI